MDSVWEQKKLEARKMLENGAESPASSARCVGRLDNECRYVMAISNFGECPDYLNQLPIPLVDFFHMVKTTTVEEVDGQCNDRKAC